MAEHPQLRYELHSLAPAGPERLRLEGQLTVAGARTALPLDADLWVLSEATIEISARTQVDRLALGLHGARGIRQRAADRVR